MKSLIYKLITLALVLGMTACSSSDDDIKAPEIVEGSQTIDIEYVGETYHIPITTADYWHATSDADWCILGRTQGGVGNIVLEISVEPNLTGVARTATVKLETIEGNHLFYTITVNQDAKSTVTIPDTNANAPEGMRSNAPYLVSKINVGWCIGNTCESGVWDGWSGNDLDIETAWGNPKVTREFVNKLKSEGFNAVRIPVRWYLHADDQLNINPAWLQRVKEIVDYAIDQDMYVVLNSHHDNWFDRLPVNYDEASIRTRFANMWGQIAEYFKAYDERLIFAGNNEMVSLNADGSENWGAPTPAQAKVLADLMQLFVDTVRATGDNNAWRCLMIQPWAANIDYAYNDFAMPTDKVDNRLILEFHNYTWGYSTEKAGDQNKYFWGQEFSDCSPWYANGEAQILAMYDNIRATFIDNGLPVIMAEFGCVQHNNSNNEERCDLSRAYYHKFVVSEARKRGIPAFYWDNGAFTGDGENFGLIDRATLEVSPRARIALDGILDGAR